jgi:cysteinyl-tRNA synthetase
VTCCLLSALEVWPESRWLRLQSLTYEQIEQRIAERKQARQEKNWHEADRIRQQLNDNGILVEDTPGGTEWKVK